MDAPPSLVGRLAGRWCVCWSRPRRARDVRHDEKRALGAYLRAELGATSRDPLLDVSDCVHGCAGCARFGSDRCNFTCHDWPA